MPHRPGEEEVSTALQEVVEHKGDEDMTEDLSRREEESPAMPSRPGEEEVVEPKGDEDMIGDLHEEEEMASSPDRVTEMGTY